MKMFERRTLSSSPMLLVLLSLLMVSFIDTTAGQIGVCYGRLSNPRPCPSDVVALYKQRNIQRMRLYDPDHEVLTALRCSNIELVLGVPNAYLERIASNQTEADTYIRDYVQNYDDVRFRYITVGTEVKPTDRAGGFLFQAMQNIEKAVCRAGLPIKVSTAIDMGATTDTYPPSRGRFKEEYKDFLQPVIEFLVNKQSPLLVNIYPFFTYENSSDIPLEYALFKPTPGHTKLMDLTDGPYIYENLFDAQLDSVHAALEKSGGASLKVAVSETGWPSKGGKRGKGKVHGASVKNARTYNNNLIQGHKVSGANVKNARTYNNNLIQHVKKGSPRRPGEPIETYIFAMFDENLKKPPGIENNWGMFFPDTKPKYDVNFN